MATPAELLAQLRDLSEWASLDGALSDDDGTALRWAVETLTALLDRSTVERPVDSIGELGGMYEKCAVCGARYPAPVGLHHTEAECLAELKRCLAEHSEEGSI